ncbi:hypothetical protein C0992_008218 [Termitomyces sp. T32_za158]|nr:hypothetical protein C0992_008218 [Termitomyces sp. T32_za158]
MQSLTGYVRRLVSGDKARFKDETLNLELDLVYLTDQVIIMGYPAEGVEGWYRNRREDAKKFLEHRHGKNFWVFNFCPILENSYDKSIFGGRVSRFPFPDHHAPPLAFMPLVAREMGAWLHGSPERIAVLHCKGMYTSYRCRSFQLRPCAAGKGRSGTMACTYLLSLDSPSPPKLQRSYSSKEWVKLRAEEVMSVVPEDDDVDPGSISNLDIENTSATPSYSKTHHTDTLNAVLDLHTSRRMKRPVSPGKKAKQGVSIPSQRRWLHYWALVLSRTAPAHLWAVPPVPSPKVKLTQIKLRMRPTPTVKAGLALAANVVLEHIKGPKNAPAHKNAHVWASLARYDDEFIDLLETWERRTRDENGRMGLRRPNLELSGQEDIRDLFKDGRWDKTKMVRTFARMAAVGDLAIAREKGEGKDNKINVFTLSSLDIQTWNAFRDELKTEDEPDDNVEGSASEAVSLNDSTSSAKERGIVLNAGREVRIKLYMGQVFMGWLWLIPTFHMKTASEGPTHFRLKRKELDFPLGLGSAIIDVEIEMEWLPRGDNEAVQPSAQFEQLKMERNLKQYPW